MEIPLKCIIAISERSNGVTGNDCISPKEIYIQMTINGYPVPPGQIQWSPLSPGIQNCRRQKSFRIFQNNER